MANFNGAPTGDNSANNGDYTPESFSDTDNTAQLPKLNENVDSHNDNNTSDIQPAADPEQNAADGNNTERKSHLGRNLVVGGVAVALAFSAWMFSKNGDNVKPTSDTDSKPTITESYNNEQNYVNDEQVEPVITQPETEPASSSGLTVDELVHELYPSSSISEAMSSNPLEVSETICDWLITDGGYSTIGAGNSGRASASFDEGGITIDSSDAGFHIYITQYNPNGIYEYDSQTIPTVDEAREIAIKNIR